MRCYADNCVFAPGKEKQKKPKQKSFKDAKKQQINDIAE